MIHNVLTRQLGLPPERVAAALAAAGIAPDRRPQTLAVGEWLRLLEALGPLEPDRRGRPHGRPTNERPRTVERHGAVAARRDRTRDPAPGR